LKKLPDNSLALNVLRPLIVDTEQEVRQNITTWVEQIHQANLSPEAEQRLLMVMTQFIEEKFRILNYKELCEMLNLTPFDQTTTFIETYQKKLQEDRIGLLIKQMSRKYHFARSTLVKLDASLRQLTLKDLEDLFVESVDMVSLREINAWVNGRATTNVRAPTPLSEQEVMPMK
jgi:GTPase SAR1 family protein